MISLSLHNLSSATSHKVEIADPLVCYCPIWFGQRERNQAIALCNLGFSYQGEDEEFSIESNLLAKSGNWVFYAQDNRLILYFEDSRWNSDLSLETLPKALSILNEQQEREDNRHRIETLIGLASGIESYQPDQISYALEAIAKWMNRYKPQQSPALQAIIEELSHD